MSVKGYVITLAVLLIFGSLPVIMYGVSSIAYWKSFGIWYVIYWSILSALFCSFVSYQKYRRFDKPMHKISDAAERVAKGDFSVYVEPEHAPDKEDYVDVMIHDFNKMVEALGSLETLKGDFIANVSHEFKTPLSVIESHAEALENENLSPEKRAEYIEIIKSSSQKLSSLVTNILKLNKIENQIIHLNNESFDLCSHLAACIISFEDKFVEKDIEVVVEIEDKATIYADRSMIEIVWNNIISNAIKFTEPGGKISVNQISDENTVIVTIEDTGFGMANDVAMRIFDKFYQGDLSHSSSGNGLGLALAKNIVELHGGEISVSSERGVGSVFKVVLYSNDPPGEE
jgi:Signal transduction histidine kinase